MIENSDDAGKRNSRQLMLNAYNARTVIPAFNTPYLPLIAPVAKALVDSNCFGLISVARADWQYFEAKNQSTVYQEYHKYCDEKFMRLHQDHVPVIDENDNKVDYMGILKTAVDLGFGSIMVDGSRLGLDENITATREVIALAAEKQIAVEAELGSVLGHEAGPMPPYEELFRTGKGFTSIDDASRFVQETGVDWLSVACGNIHGSIQGSARDARKVQARLNIQHVAKLREAFDIPIVLHGGSGIEKQCILDGIANGIAKINIGTDLRQPYEKAIKEGKSIEDVRAIIYRRVCDILENVLEIQDSRDVINPD